MRAGNRTHPPRRAEVCKKLPEGTNKGAWLLGTAYYKQQKITGKCRDWQTKRVGNVSRTPPSGHGNPSEMEHARHSRHGIGRTCAARAQTPVPTGAFTISRRKKRNQTITSVPITRNNNHIITVSGGTLRHYVMWAVVVVIRPSLHVT